MREAEVVEVSGEMPRSLKDIGGRMSNYGKMLRYQNEGERSFHLPRLTTKKSHHGRCECAKCHRLDLLEKSLQTEVK